MNVNAKWTEKVINMFYEAEIMKSLENSNNILFQSDWLFNLSRQESDTRACID